MGNKRLNEPLQKANAEVQTLRTELANYEKDKQSLLHTRSRLVVLEQQHSKLVDDHRKLEGKYDELHRRKEDLLANYQDSLQDVIERSALQNEVLGKRLDDVQAAVDQKDVQLAAVLQAAHLEPSALEMVTSQLEDMLKTKNRAIKDLHFELAKIATTHQDVIKAYERKAQGSGLPPLDLEVAGLLHTTVHD
eukprot:NODE_1679_length_791_cov_146.691375_g1403_i0.p1 GENE.NODE_1679_length_791_cov_146.691375_g1403_i0~~NODE_1679_length_791_cov_146.691375_g1403_i0.p1  ORF type:complete len:200 (+),score=96.92 NODE_1679_length_791_cov_146.691375_g1403_i0:26-601(+)